mgnify:CR=1 FL=1
MIPVLHTEKHLRQTQLVNMYNDLRYFGYTHKPSVIVFGNDLRYKTS